MTYPGAIDQAIATWLKGNADGSLRPGVSQLSERYRKGETSASADLASYLVARTPATYAAVSAALDQASQASPGVSPQSCLDVGCGPGTATWAALAQWPQLANIAMRDTNLKFLDLAKSIARDSNIPALTGADIASANITSTDWPQTDLIIASYVFAERPVEEAATSTLKLWRATRQILLIVEPGTPRGFERINTIRTALIGQGAHIAAPCTHAERCPMVRDDWCHFSIRLARSRAHMHAKQGILPYEDEPYSYIVASRSQPAPQMARILARPSESKFAKTFKLCSNSGLTTHTVATRDKSAYKNARKLNWGDAFTPEPKE